MSDDRPGATPGSFEFNRPTIVGLLYAGGFITGVSAIIGLILAIVWKGEPHEPWEETHYVYHIRTFVIGLLACVVGFLLAVVGIGLLILAAVAVWTIVRVVLSLLNAQKRLPMPNPRTLLV